MNPATAIARIGSILFRNSGVRLRQSTAAESTTYAVEVRYF